MRGRARAVLAVGITSVAMLAAACGGGGETPPATGEGGQAGGEIVIKGCTPENPLVAGATSETCGGNVVDAFTAKLVHYNTETAAPEMDIAQSIETKDNQNFTIKIKGLQVLGRDPGHGEELRRRVELHRVRPERSAGSYFFEPVEGYADLQCVPAPTIPTARQPPKSKSCRVSRWSTTHLHHQDQSRRSRTCRSASATRRSPRSRTLLRRPEAFKTKPIGAGPYKVDEVSDTQIV